MTYLEEKVNEILESLKNSSDKTVHISTCSSPAYGWDVKYHYAMSSIAHELRTKHNLIVNSSVNFGVTDWYVISLD